MPTGLPDDLKRSPRERDGHRCLECGVAVATDRGCPRYSTLFRAHKANGRSRN